MLYLLLSFFVSFISCMIFINIKNPNFSDLSKGIQKFHDWKVPRIGGLGIFLSLVFVSVILFLKGEPFSKEVFLTIVSALPVFLGGITEDLTKRITPKVRLTLAFISGILACFLLNADIVRTDIPIFDEILKDYPVISVAFTSFALAGISNAMNIIDGFNGLAPGVAVIVFLSYAYVSFLVGDPFLLHISLIIFAAVMGFFLWNFPLGKIFLGDGGSYILGFLAGLVGILLVNIHQEVSAWFPFLLLIYPIWEVLFSMWRRKFIRKFSPYEADASHLHSLIYKRIVRTKFKDLDGRIRNSLTSPYLWMLQLLATIPALLFWNNKYMLVVSTFIFIVVYTWLYFRIIKFKIPKFLKV
jgi:UDP-N-acetylmuramyl pentapeptide phosphotransferase/UDP-N-acetylglucosamine-1-phosphate transferase